MKSWREEVWQASLRLRTGIRIKIMITAFLLLLVDAGNEVFEEGFGI